MITVLDNYFYIHTKRTSYIIRKLSDGTLNHCYYGGRLPEENLDCYHRFIPHDITVRLTEKDAVTTPDALPMECPGFGRGDFRRPAAVIANNSGRTVNDYRYKSHQILTGKPQLQGLPRFGTDTGNLQTLRITLEDMVTGAEVVCSYTPLDEADVITRHMELYNAGTDTLQIESAASAVVDFEQTEFDMISLGGAWERERHPQRYPVHRGESSVSSRYGLGGHHSNPFAALAEKDAGEDHGRVYGFALVYSGNFLISAEAGQYDGTRLWMGLHPDLFSWELAPGERFTTPEAVLTFSAEGIGGMTRNFHRACRDHLGACAEPAREHPVVLNLWEALNCDISEEKLLRVIDASRGLGVDTLVIDDGWFGCRNDATTSLGDWQADPCKFPRGLGPIAEACRENGMRLGLWFEPEMISRKSRLYEQHPDWCIRLPDLEPVEIRDQLILDMSRPEVTDFLYEAISRVLRSCNISYVKWDMNRSMTDHGSQWLPPHRQKEQSHRHILGVYHLMDRLTGTFPEIFFEGCASGGGRFDFGMLYYMPQIWTSDCTDAWERMLIQYGTSYVYPPETISAHVSACPNIGTGRTVPFRSRCDTAGLFSYGYELDPITLNPEERMLVISETARHRAIDQGCGRGQFYRLRNPFSGNTCSWQLVSGDQNRSAVFYGVKLRQPNFCGDYLRLAGLDPRKIYRVEPLGWQAAGAVLMQAGIPVRAQAGDFTTVIFELTALQEQNPGNR